MKIGIIGFGIVGQAQYSIIKNCDIVIHDLHKNIIPNYNELLECKIIFICVPTNTKNNKQDTGSFDATLKKLYKAKYSGLIIIKSTILYDNIKSWVKKLNIIFNPEFLTDNNSFDDAKFQDLIILGGDIHLTKIAEDFYTEYTILDNPEFNHMSIQDAINIKYIRNIYGAYKVLFWEYVQDVTGNSRKMYDLFSKLPLQGDMSRVGMDGYRGYGGKCFTKDVIAFNTNTSHELTEFMINYNTRLQE